MRTISFAVLLATFLTGGLRVHAQTSAELRQDETRYNYQSRQGVPLSSTAGTPVGSDGRAPAPASGSVGTDGQFRGVVTFGSLVVPRSSGLAAGQTLAANAQNLNLPRGTVNNQLRVILLSARVGAPVLSRSISFQFGAVIPVPETDEYGVLLSTVNNAVTPPRPVVAPENYWLAEPHSTDAHASDRGFYWSPHVRQVFAVESGPVDIPWRKAQPSTAAGSPPGVSTVTVNGVAYTILTKRYLISGSAVKPSRKIYWTHGDFAATGKPVTVPQARVGNVKIVYNNSVRETVAVGLPPASAPQPPPGGYRLDERRTLWFDQTTGTINAYNLEGRVFLELLGSLNPDRITREHLGIEIVDVIREPTPEPITTELGERIPAYADGTPDTDLWPDPIQDLGQTFAYRHNVSGTDRTEFFATRETQNLNDLQIHWLEEGLAGLRWPFRFVRYRLVWPVDVAKYSHYVRPQVATDAEARTTAVPLPNENAPFIQYQDPLDQIRGRLTEKFEYYTFLTPAFPAHRALLRLTSGAHVRFERVLSWLDTNLRSGNFAGSVAAGLDPWSGNTRPFDQLNDQRVARTFTGTVQVGQRISAPPGEAGAGIAADYLAGHIVARGGKSYHPRAYRDPFTQGFEAANEGAIIPVNAIPGQNTLDVLWFRRNPLTEDALNRGFKESFWPAVIARYTIQWPSDPSEIVLASNDGSGPLPSLQARGSIYVQNDRALPGYNPNEEHALMQGGQAYALRDDLNQVAPDANYSSDPFVLLDYTEEDGRPAMRVFKVLREKVADGIVFDYEVKAGTVLQAPMPLPLLEIPFAPKLAGQPRVSLNREVLDWPVNNSTLNTPLWTLETDTPHFLKPYESVSLETPRGTASPELRWFFVTTTTATSLTGYPSPSRPYPLGPFEGAPAASANQFRYQMVNATGLAVNNPVVIAAPSAAQHWTATITEINQAQRYVEVDFGIPVPDAARGASLLVLRDSAGATGRFNGWRLALEPLPVRVTDTTRQTFYTGFTVQDRKGNRWVYRGPHEQGGTAALTMQFYYRTLPGFFFPSLALNAQPAVGTLTPYLRTPGPNGTFLGDAVRGNANNRQEADGNALGIRYRAVWPPNAPVLEMAETLTLPKRGLPAIRGQSSLEVLYQQSHVAGGDTRHSVVLHDPTREKQFDLAAPDSTTDLTAIPGSVTTSSYRGKTYFPKLPPHLVERFFFDPNRGDHGALVLNGTFVAPGLGDSYLLLNVLSASDEAALKDLCPASDTAKRPLWNRAIEGLQTSLETFVENTSKPGTYIANAARTVTVGRSSVAAITNDDQAVDSYALSATGPGIGYVSLVAGNGMAFTPEGDPVTVQILRVVDTLYRGEVNIVESSNPLNEKLTLQQVVDLAGQTDKFTYEWKIASPVDGFPPPVYQNQPRTLLTSGRWSHLPFVLPSDTARGVQAVAPNWVTSDVFTTVNAIAAIPFSSASLDGTRFSFAVTAPHRLRPGVAVVMRKTNGEEIAGTVHNSTTSTQIVVQRDASQTVPAAAADIVQLHERSSAGLPQSIVFRTFTRPGDASLSDIWLSLDLDPDLGARVYLDGQILARIGLGSGDTPPSSPPQGLSPLPRAFRLTPSALAGGVRLTDGSIQHQVSVELFSQAVPDAPQRFDLRIEAFESVDVTANQWLPMDAERFADGIRAILGGTADVRSLADNYVIMRYQARENTHASWRGAPNDAGRNVAWSQWTSPQLAEGWIKRVLKGINPFNQRITDLFNNQVNTDVSLVAQAGPRWEGDVALNLDAINDSGLIEIYETVLNRGKMLSIGGGINFGPANDALLLAAGYLNDLYLMVGNEAWADASNPTIGIGTKDNTYGDVATALFAFRGQLPSLLEEELALLRGRDDFLLPGVETRPVYNRMIWNYTRGIDAGEVIYALNYNILDQNTDGRVDASDARKLFPQGHGDAYGHFLTALKGYYSLLLDPNFDWVPRIEAVTVLGKPVSVDYQDERKFAAAAAALARAGRQVFDLTWRRDFKSGTGQGWAHFSETKGNTSTRNVPTTRYWGADHWAARTGQGAYLNWVVGNAILPDTDPDPTHQGSIQQVDRTTVPELRELPAVGESLQASMDSAEGSLTPLGLPANGVPFDLNPLSIANGQNTTHFEQIYQRAKDALKNAVVAFDDAKDVTRLMRAEEDGLADLRTEVSQQELAYKNSLVELYGTPYPEDIGPGRTYPTGYDGPDLAHYMYVDNREATFGGLLDPTADVKWRIDLQTFNPNWLASSNVYTLLPNTKVAASTEDRISDFSFIVKARSWPVDGVSDPSADYLTNSANYLEYNLSAHGFFKKPSAWVGRRMSPGRIQQAVSEIAQARNAAYEAFYNADAAKYDLDWAILSLERKVDSHSRIRDLRTAIVSLETVLGAAKLGVEIGDKILDATSDQIDGVTKTIAKSLPTMFVAGLAAGGDLTSAARGALEGTGLTIKSVTEWSKVATFSIIQALDYSNELQKRFLEFEIADEEWEQELRDATSELRDKVYGAQNQFTAINAALQALDDAQRNYRSLLAEGERMQAEREVFRQRAAAVIQGFRTRDAAFRIFRNEKLERYKSVFDLAAQYTFLAAQAFDYETGLLHTPKGREFINRIIRSRALGVINDGEPQFAGSNTGDPGLSSVMAEMNADWSVLRARLGFKNPDAYGTTASLRTEHFRILPSAEGDALWTDKLNAGRRANLLDDSDVRRYCMQIDPRNGLPVPGIILEFSTTIADGLNLFGRPLAPGDHAFSAASFATKIFGIGVALDGYKGMDDPNANSASVTDGRGSSPADPNLAFLDPDALAANPYVYLIPVGVDSMRSPPLGDQSVIRTWTVDDVAIPLPFNIGGSAFSTTRLWQSADSLTEPLFTLRKHQPFRPVASADIFGALVVYWTGGELERTQYNNTRLLGRSVWNSRWKLIIPGRTLLSDPNEGLDRLVRTVKDVKLYFMTYSYAGN